MDGEAQLGDEDCREECDGCHTDNIVHRANVVETELLGIGGGLEANDNVLDVVDRQIEAYPQGDEGHNATDTENGKFVCVPQRAAHNVDLEDERPVDSSVDEPVQDLSCCADTLRLLQGGSIWIPM